MLKKEKGKLFYRQIQKEKLLSSIKEIWGNRLIYIVLAKSLLVLCVKVELIKKIFVNYTRIKILIVLMFVFVEYVICVLLIKK